MSRVFLSLGSNMGNREGTLKEAVGRISRLPDTQLIDASSIYETDPVGYTEQDCFLNMAVSVETTLEPIVLLGELQKIEKDLKRVRAIRWGPRTIDIDILLFGERKLDLPQLTIPHPRMLERAFVLVPLKEIGVQTVGATGIDTLILRCPDQKGIRLYKPSYTKGSKKKNEKSLK